jgi:hypothetical protein
VIGLVTLRLGTPNTHMNSVRTLVGGAVRQQTPGL